MRRYFKIRGDAPGYRPGASRATSWLVSLAAAALYLSAGLLSQPLRAGTAHNPTTATTLKLATWNLEWLLTPATFNALKDHCSPSGATRRSARRSIPCDVAADLERSASDLAGLARYARALDADVIAMQEVDGVNAARQIFPRHEFCFTGGPAVQNTGFAIRRGLPFRCGADLAELSLGDSVRRGATLVLFPGSRRELRLLAVHLKSGCARAPLDSHDYSCERLSRQRPALRDWLQQASFPEARFAVLGDFNRDLLAESATGFEVEGSAGLWRQLQESASGRLLNTAQDQPFHNCHVGQPHRGYIDYILIGGALREHLVAGSFERLSYSASDAWRLKLSDHCPVAVKLRID